MKLISLKINMPMLLLIILIDDANIIDHAIDYTNVNIDDDKIHEVVPTHNIHPNTTNLHNMCSNPVDSKLTNTKNNSNTIVSCQTIDLKQ